MRTSVKPQDLGRKQQKVYLAGTLTSLKESLKELPFDWQFQTPKIATETKGAVCISGKLSSFKTKAEATKALSYAGYVVKTSLTKDVIFLINESGIESAKTKEARERGITIITSLNELIGD